MQPRNLEEAYRLALARRHQARQDRITACVPFLMHSTFRAQPRPTGLHTVSPPATASGGAPRQSQAK